MFIGHWKELQMKVIDWEKMRRVLRQIAKIILRGL